MSIQNSKKRTFNKFWNSLQLTYPMRLSTFE